LLHPAAAIPGQQIRHIGTCHPDGIVRRHGIVAAGRQVDHVAYSRAVWIIGVGGAARFSIEVDEQVAIAVPVGAGPVEAQRLVIPGHVEPLRVARGSRRRDLVGADERAAARRPASVAERRPQRRVARHEVRRVGAVHVDRPNDLPTPVAERVAGTHVRPVHADVAQHLFVVARRVGGMGDAGRFQAHGRGLPGRVVASDLRSVRRLAPINGQGRGGVVHGVALAQGHCATSRHDRDRGVYRRWRHRIYRHVRRDLASAAGAVGGAHPHLRDLTVKAILRGLEPAVRPRVTDERRIVPGGIVADAHLHAVHRAGDRAGQVHAARLDLVRRGIDRARQSDRGRVRRHPQCDDIRARLCYAIGVGRHRGQFVRAVGRRCPLRRPGRRGERAAFPRGAVERSAVHGDLQAAERGIRRGAAPHGDGVQRRQHRAVGRLEDGG